MKNHNYFVYITTNKSKKVLYTGMTNDLRARLGQHLEDAMNKKKTFAGKYNCHFLVYWERHQYVNHAIEREKEIKGWKRFKKEDLINSINPDWRFLNDEVD
ncbi:GIY-YIG nuclease family protein [Ekhidna sp.]|uniref:GIY-YIG nuclease family protein n=1 Tax=Ekhidna sp. TaxID=2608089 RepID=UPI003BA93007